MEGETRKLEAFPPSNRCSGHILHSVAPFQHRFLSTCHTQDLVTALPAYGKFMSNNSHLSHTISGNFPSISKHLQLSLYQEWLHAVPVAGIARNSALAIVRTDLQSSQKAAHTHGIKVRMTLNDILNGASVHLLDFHTFHQSATRHAMM